MKTIAMIFLGFLMSISLNADTPDTLLNNSSSSNKNDITEITILKSNKTIDFVLDLQYEILLKESEIATYKVFIEEEGPNRKYSKKIKELNNEIDEINELINQQL